MRSNVKKLNPAHEDTRGQIWDIVEGKNLQHIGYITSKKGAVRGNHYHKKAGQYLFVLSGKLERYTKDLRDKNAEVKAEIVERGMLAIEEPEVVHAYVALEDSEFIDMTTRSREDDGYEEDTFRYQLTK